MANIGEYINPYLPTQEAVLDYSYFEELDRSPDVTMYNPYERREVSKIEDEMYASLVSESFYFDTLVDTNTVPEPALLMMLAIGAAGLARKLRRF